jgi:4-amino-4-deoxy-L-arabinose transferase-like glycosyltransferase
MNTVYKGKYNGYYVLILIVVLAAVMRLYGLAGESYWHDEITMLHVAQGDLVSILKGGRPPLFIILAHFWIDLFGTSESATRTLPALLGTASIPLIYVVAKALFNEKVGLVSAFLMAVSQYQIYYSQDIRYYSLFVLMTLVSFYFYISALKIRKLLYFILYAFSTILLYYAHDFGLFIIAAQCIYFVLNIRSLRSNMLKWLLSQLIILAEILPAIIPAHGRLQVALDQTGCRNLHSGRLMTFMLYIGAGLDYPAPGTYSCYSLFIFRYILVCVYFWKEEVVYLAQMPYTGIYNRE